MIDTNQLLAIAFTLISNFNNVIQLPPDRLPQRQEDLQSVVIGSPHSPMDLWLVHKRGDEFWIRDGVVHGYLSPDTYFEAQNPKEISRLYGAAAINSNQVICLATNTLQRLTKTGDPLKMLSPRVRTPHNPNLPFYSIRWPVTESWAHLPAADIEIDARKGKAVGLKLWATEYFDYGLAQEISNRVFKADPPGAKTLTLSRRNPKVPIISPNQAEHLLPKWLHFCSRLNLSTGNLTNLTDIDWGNCFCIESPFRDHPGHLYKVQFKNNVFFQAVEDTIIVHNGENGIFVGAWGDKPPEQWKKFVAAPTVDWQELATRFDTLLEHLGVSRDYLNRYTPARYLHGTGGVSHCIVNWYETEKYSRIIGKKSLDSLREALSVEFDLSAARPVSVTFFDFKLLEWQNTASENRH